jgi:hypothetical protein
MLVWQMNALEIVYVPVCLIQFQLGDLKGNVTVFSPYVFYKPQQSQR